MSALYLPIRAISRSQNVRIGKQTILTDKTAYIDINSPARRDLERHFAIGAIVVVGAVTASNTDSVVLSGGAVTAHVTGLAVDVTAGELLDRSTGAVLTGAGASDVTLMDADATLDRIDLISWDNLGGIINIAVGTLAQAGLAVAPVAPDGVTALATVAVPHTATVPGTITDIRSHA